MASTQSQTDAQTAAAAYFKANITPYTGDYSSLQCLRGGIEPVRSVPCPEDERPNEACFAAELSLVESTRGDKADGSNKYGDGIWRCTDHAAIEKIRDMLNNIRLGMKTDSTVAGFKHTVGGHFELAANDVVVQVVKTTLHNGATATARVPVVAREHYFRVLTWAHIDDNGKHLGRDTMFQRLQAWFSTKGLPKTVCTLFIGQCPKCSRRPTRKSKSKSPPPPSTSATTEHNGVKKTNRTTTKKAAKPTPAALQALENAVAAGSGPGLLLTTTTTTTMPAPPSLDAGPSTFVPADQPAPAAQRIDVDATTAPSSSIQFPAPGAIEPDDLDDFDLDDFDLDDFTPASMPASMPRFDRPTRFAARSIFDEDAAISSAGPASMPSGIPNPHQAAYSSGYGGLGLDNNGSDTFAPAASMPGGMPDTNAANARVNGAPGLTNAELGVSDMQALWDDFRTGRLPQEYYDDNFDYYGNNIDMDGILQ